MNRRANWRLSERFPFFSPQSPYDMKESGPCEGESELEVCQVCVSIKSVIECGRYPQ